ncbi:hypothetical protein NDU88_002365 [Pleurodeles waltl]|uniref:Uncharacterized protein n=1 Tax=Pleurodeles waltl TaxID=8319 RepID=A0AAV7W343_PLEWA|nr:hypothetical protein NDU88_002365 [Pleurodeles waltl]
MRPLDLTTILKAIQDSREVVKNKADGLRMGASLIRQDLRKMMESVTKAEARISSAEDNLTTLKTQMLRPTLARLPTLLLTLPQDTTVIGGDFNTALGPVRDTSNDARPGPWTGSTCRSTWVDSLGLCVVWR